MFGQPRLTQDDVVGMNGRRPKSSGDWGTVEHHVHATDIVDRQGASSGLRRLGLEAWARPHSTGQRKRD